MQRIVLVAQLPSQRRKIGLGRIGDRQRQQRSLDRPARLEYLPRFLGRWRGHHRAAVGPQLDDVVVRERLQHPAD